MATGCQAVEARQLKSPEVDNKTRLEKLWQRRAMPRGTVRTRIAVATLLSCAIIGYLLVEDFMALSIMVLMWVTVLIAPWLLLASDPFRSKRRRRFRFSLSTLFVVVTLTCAIALGIRLLQPTSGEGIVVAVILFLVFLVLTSSGVFGTFQGSLRRGQILEESTDLGSASAMPTETTNVASESRD